AALAFLQQVAGGRAHGAPADVVAAVVVDTGHTQARCAGGRTGDDDGFACAPRAAITGVAGIHTVAVAAIALPAFGLAAAAAAVGRRPTATVDPYLQRIADGRAGGTPAHLVGAVVVCRRYAQAGRRRRRQQHGDGFYGAPVAATAGIAGLYAVAVAA